MRIVQIISSLDARHGGPSVSVPALSRALARLGHTVTLLASGPQAQTSMEENLTIRITPRDWPERLGGSAELKRALDASDAEVIHHHGLWLRPLHYSHLRARRARIPLVISPRGMMTPWAWQHHRVTKYLAEHWVHPGAFAGAAGWHATSDPEAGDIHARGFLQPIQVAPNGVVAPDPKARDVAKAYWVEQCPDLAKRPVALFYSRLHAKKRVLELIDLWLKREPDHWLLAVVGIPEGYTVDQLTDHVRQAGGIDRVRIFDGTSKPAPYPVASLFLLPSHSENFGLVVAEAMANGIPVVVTDTTPWSSLSSLGLGWCVPWSDFGAALNDALSESPGQLHERGCKAKAWILAEYPWEKSAARLADFYRGLPAK